MSNVKGSHLIKSKTIKPKKELGYLSRSVLAEKLGVSLKELTQLLIESGWLMHHPHAEKGKEWKLTAKGEFEGGVYKESKKFGQYIVWPESVMTHPALSGVQQARITASAIAKHYQTSAKIINRVFAEMGWLVPYAKGWTLTALGEQYGGLQESHSETGVPYVLWDRALMNHPHLAQQLAYYQGIDVPTAILNNQTFFLSLDGRYIASIAELIIANWLYLAGMTYAYRRTVVLSQGQIMVSDFYLPKSSIHIHFLAVDISPSDLADQLARQALAKESQCNLIELSLADIDNLDSILTKALLQLGVSIG
jgi:hypothetical protein